MRWPWQKKTYEPLMSTQIEHHGSDLGDQSSRIKANLISMGLAEDSDPTEFPSISEAAVGAARASIKIDRKYSIETHLSTTTKMVVGLKARVDALDEEQKEDEKAWAEGEADRARASQIATEDLAERTKSRADEMEELTRLLAFYEQAPIMLAPVGILTSVPVPETIDIPARPRRRKPAATE